MSSQEISALGPALREYRIRTGTTQQELAELAGISVRTVRHIEQGEVQRPQGKSIRRLSAVIGLTASAAAEALSVDVLGPLTVRRGDKVIVPSSTQQRCLLGLLALQANEVVSQAEIVDVVWGDRPPTTWRELLHSTVSRLRKVLPQAVVARSAGYLLQIDPQRLDLARFDELVARARSTSDPSAALPTFESAVACWRGPVVADLPERLQQHPTAIAAGQRRLCSALNYADVAMEQGVHEQAALLLLTLVRDEPLHEALHARLMLAFAGCGQQAAALMLYGQIRARLADELAVEPGPELRGAHLRVLRGSADVVETSLAVLRTLGADDLRRISEELALLRSAQRTP